ncbi:MAG TPA: hypothetical protein DFS52_22915, partial [Myxococcales bacterium]|nr:hypothetical protein [Myxococcales bacterium]
MPACPKCGSQAANALRCPVCKATFARPLSFDEDPAPVASPLLSRELDLDRRATPRQDLSRNQPDLGSPPPVTSSEVEGPSTPASQAGPSLGLTG